MMKNENLKLRGTKLYLRYPKSEDLAEFTALNIASRKFHRGLVNSPTDEKSFIEYLTRNESDANECLLICEFKTEKIAGAINLSRIFRGGFQNAYLGYFTGVDFAGKGLMSEAICLTLRFAFKNLKLHRLEANVQPKNVASITVLRKNNFTKEGFSRKYLKIGGRWRDHERWAIIFEDWKKFSLNAETRTK
ncbi:MAG: GNAT family N-acetyltransferase [Acidobacteriota bacterium]|nr:GNAT family N-acetyltransferase [Acidobacteriota bacterium]